MFHSVPGRLIGRQEVLKALISCYIFVHLHICMTEHFPFGQESHSVSLCSPCMFPSLPWPAFCRCIWVTAHGMQQTSLFRIDQWSLHRMIFHPCHPSQLGGPGNLSQWVQIKIVRWYLVDLARQGWQTAALVERGFMWIALCAEGWNNLGVICKHMVRHNYVYIYIYLSLSHIKFIKLKPLGSVHACRKGPGSIMANKWCTLRSKAHSPFFGSIYNQATASKNPQTNCQMIRNFLYVSFSRLRPIISLRKTFTMSKSLKSSRQSGWPCL